MMWALIYNNPFVLDTAVWFCHDYLAFCITRIPLEFWIYNLIWETDYDYSEEVDEY